MTTTERFQLEPDFFTSIKECKSVTKKDKYAKNSNPRYVHFTQNHFTAGDEEQFETYRDAENYEICEKTIHMDYNLYGV